MPTQLTIIAIYIAACALCWVEQAASAARRLVCRIAPGNQLATHLHSRFCARTGSIAIRLFVRLALLRTERQIRKPATTEEPPPPQTLGDRCLGAAIVCVLIGAAMVTAQDLTATGRGLL